MYEQYNSKFFATHDFKSDSRAKFNALILMIIFVLLAHDFSPCYNTPAVLTYSPILNRLHRLLQAAESIVGKQINGAQAIVRKGDEVLLIKTTYRPYWEFPGGKIEPLEAPESAAIRETKEEARVFIKSIERKLGTYTKKHFYNSITIHVYVAGEWEALDLWRPTLEISDRRFFSIHELPDDISAPTRKRLEEMLAAQEEFSGKW